MIKLPRISGRECVRALEKKGFYFKRQAGGHIILRRDDPLSKLDKSIAKRVADFCAKEER